MTNQYFYLALTPKAMKGDNVNDFIYSPHLYSNTVKRRDNT